MADAPENRENRLKDEASAYLRQHAKNPVDWYPWGPEALEKARREDKPIFLSVGYSACHWCHVMERESFEDPSVAVLLAAGFVSIKVDREERPDVDHLYQTAAQLMGRGGGWPLSVFLTPDERPFFAGTYFPPERRHGMPSFREVLVAVRRAFDDDRRDLGAQAEEVTSSISRALGAARNDGDVSPSPELLDRAAAELGRRFDDRHGGFGDAPKFPNAMGLAALLSHGVRRGDEESLSRVRHALFAMRAGGLWDQLGGGFHRYSTDARWLVPHFEKMLYDNALLLDLYLDAHRALGVHEDVVRELVGWLLREMRAPEGAFFASMDADSEGEEGRFFVFSPEDIDDALDDPTERALVKAHLGVTARGNFEHTGKTVLSLALPLERVAGQLGLSVAEAEATLRRARAMMLAWRERRPRPFRDEKRLVAWNALLVGPLAEAGVALDEPSYVEAALGAMRDLSSLVDGGRVGRYAMGERKVTEGFLDDHAGYGLAAFRLWGVTGDPSWLTRARAVAAEIVREFWDDEQGVFFFSRASTSSLVARTEDAYDQSTPSGSSQAALLLLSLGAVGDTALHAKGARYLEQMAGGAARNPLAFGRALLGLEVLVGGSCDVVVVGPRDDERAKALVRAAFSAYLPTRVVAQIDPSVPDTITAAGPLAEGKAPSSVPVAYVCRGRTCSLPARTPEALARLLHV